MNTRSLLISAAMAGALSALLSTSPFISLLNCLLCAWLWLGGIFAVWLYRRNSGDAVDLSQGAIIGLVTGLFGAVIASLLSAIIGFGTNPFPAETMAQLEEQLGDAARILTDPSTAVAVGIVFNLILYPMFGAIGGLIGATILKNRPAR